MALLRRRPLPDAIKAVVLPPGERRLAWALTQDDQPVVATELALLLPAGEAPKFERVVVKRLLVTNVADLDNKLFLLFVKYQ